MAMLIPPSGSQTSGHDTPFHVATREISLDFSKVGPDQSPNEIGALSATAFRVLLDRFAAIPPINLVDGDPQLIVTAKRGRFLVLPSNGKVLARPANDPRHSYERFETEELAAYLGSSDRMTAPDLPAAKSTSLIGSASAMATKKETAKQPPAPIYGSFPDLAARATPTPAVASPSSAATRPNSLPLRRRLLAIGAGLLLLGAAGAGWFMFRPPPAVPPAPAARPPEFDLVKSTDELTRLRQRFGGTYATSGEAGERLLELRADGTFRLQEFGSGLTRTTNRTGPYTFAYRHGTTTPVIRAGGLGAIEVRNEKDLFCQGAVFIRLP